MGNGGLQLCDLGLDGRYAGNLLFLGEGLVGQNGIDLVLLISQSLLSDALSHVLLGLDLNLGSTLVLQNVHKNSDNNNGILAITEFRQAFNLALNRTDIVEKIWPGSAVPCFGLLSPGYYYDIENAPTLEDGGVYRNSVEAMTGILRAYGFTEENGLWTDGIFITEPPEINTI